MTTAPVGETKKKRFTILPAGQLDDQKERQKVKENKIIWRENALLIFEKVVI